MGLSADQLASALENIGGFVGQLASAVEQLFAAVQNFLTGIRESFSALLALLDDEPARIFPALRRIEKRDCGAYRRAYQKPSDADRIVFTGHKFTPKQVQLHCIA